jgi:GT2 family glycosyltransferase
MRKKSSPKIKLCTIILEYQNSQLTLETIESLKSALIPSRVTHHIIVIDNSPVPDGVLQKKLPRHKNVDLITTHENTGFAQGNNQGITRALEKKYTHIMMLNNDVLVDKYFIKHLLIAMDNGADIVVPKIYFAKGYEFHKDKYKPSEFGKVIWYAGGYFDWNNVFGKHIGIDQVDKGQFDKAKPIDFANACCVMIKREVFKKIGLLDTDYFLYFEDADFSYRAYLAGFKILYEPKSKIYHKVSSSSGSGSKFQDYYLTRNRLLFGYKYAPTRTKLALFKQSVIRLVTGRPGEKQGILDYYLKKLGKGKSV